MSSIKTPVRLELRAPRKTWRERVEASGLLWHGADGDPYWSEDRNLVFTLEAAEVLEAAANELHEMCLAACEQIVRRGWWDRLAVPEAAIGMIETSWMVRDPSLYGRFDLAWTGRGTPKLLEYNADTPTSLLEAAVIQWQWLEDVAPEGDQLNSLHEALVERWKTFPEQMIHFACTWDFLEDRQTIAYLAETAEQAGKTVELMDMGEIGFSPEGRFIDMHDQPIERLFKLYPWEWMSREPFFEQIGQERSRFTEPAWKMMLSNKGLLPILWELNPGHPLLLPASYSREGLGNVDRWVAKPFFGREGNGVSFHGRESIDAPPPLPTDDGPIVYQAQADLFQAGGQHIVWGLWMVDDECRGLSARGDDGPVTGNLSRFIPHRIES